MVKKKVDILDAVKGEISLYSKQLRSCIDRNALLRAYQTRRRSERMYAYHGILRDACCTCFRGTNISADGRKCTVWGFNGKIWVIVSPAIFADAVGDAIISAAGAGDFVVKGDWVEKRSMMLTSAYAGVCTSPAVDVGSYVGFENGVWDFANVSSPVYHPFEDRCYVTDLLPYCYDSGADCPLWKSFLRMMLPDRDIERLQRFLGLGVIRRRMMPHVVEETLWLVGSGANGKTTIENTVRAVYGYDAVSEASMSDLLDKNQVMRMLTYASIEGKLFNICSEVDLGDMSRGSDAFKKLCSGEPQSARGIGKDIHIAYDIPFLIFSMNQRPSNKRMDAAFRRRIVEIHFRRSVRQDDMDAALSSKLRGELSGIRNWMIEGYLKLQKDGFRFDAIPEEDYMESNGQYFDIFAKREGIRPSAWAGRNEVVQYVGHKRLYEVFCKFCRDELSSLDVPTEKMMSLDMKRLGFAKVRRAAGMFYEVYCDHALDYTVI